jgi:phosphatidylserine/phosphatidylglycerophosphate/cardiolipin synthase-like enzyme
MRGPRLSDYAHLAICGLIACAACDAPADSGLAARLGDGERVTDVIFSPQPPAQAHSVRIAELIDQAERSLDIAVYSFNDPAILAALAAAVERGVEVRFLYERAREDRKLSGPALGRSRSAELERRGVDVRWVNKIMHHKLMIVDGPRDDPAATERAWLVTGSGNWSKGAATVYDENTLFLRGHRELVLRVQQEFERLWAHSRDFVGDPGLASRPSAWAIADDAILDEPDTHAYFTSANFDLRGDDTFVASGRDEVGDALVAAIFAAERSIRLASSHLRLRAVADALSLRAAEEPALDIRVYLDGQEFISAAAHARQLKAHAACLADAGPDEAARRECDDRGLRLGYALGEAGVPVRYKYYAYRWHPSYAEQMHHKYMLVDDDELWTGSYNLSPNAEHNTFENVLVFRGPDHAALVAAFAANFEALWDTGRDRRDDLEAEIAAGEAVPLVFPAIALTYAEVVALRQAIRAACPNADARELRGRRTCE